LTYYCTLQNFIIGVLCKSISVRKMSYFVTVPE
jgi:hypothetical protein